MFFSWLTWFLMEFERREKQTNCLVDCSRSHILPLFIGAIVKSIFTNFFGVENYAWDVLTQKKTRPLRDFEPISFWWCLFFCCPANLGPVNAGHSDAEVWTDSWLGSYRTISTQQVRPGAEIGRVSLWGWDEGVEVLKVITTGRCGATRGDDELWIWYQCILEGALIEGSDLLFASHKTSSKKARKK